MSELYSRNTGKAAYNPSALFPVLHGMLLSDDRLTFKDAKGRAIPVEGYRMAKFIIHYDEFKAVLPTIRKNINESFERKGHADYANECADAFIEFAEKSRQYNLKLDPKRDVVCLSCRYPSKAPFDRVKFEQFNEYRFTAKITLVLYKRGVPIPQNEKYKHHFTALDLVVNPHDKEKRGVYRNMSPKSKATPLFDEARATFEESRDAYDNISSEGYEAFGQNKEEDDKEDNDLPF